nr:aminotransferase class I/II-fold pyridoxal phosphate-dependent enzyme [Gammaproteobacteria bacterium]
MIPGPNVCPNSLTGHYSTNSAAPCPVCPIVSSKREAKTPRTLKYFFHANADRVDRWNRLNTVAARLSQAQQSGLETTELEAAVHVLFEDIAPLEQYWAFPGKALMTALGSDLTAPDYSHLAHGVNRLARALMGESYRRHPGAWKLLDEPDEEGSLAIDYYEPRDLARPYFEVLVVRDNPVYESEERMREEIRRLRRPEDPFVYEVVRASSFEDALVGVLINHNLQSVVIYDGFPYQSRFDLQITEQQLAGLGDLAADPSAPEGYGIALAQRIHRIRPELDLYLMSDRSIEAIAGRAGLANIRRLFFDIEELMELHLSILEGVQERYDTPYFTNLKQYARRPVGTFHALPVARGKSIFKSHWIRDVGYFYGPNLFLAESSATTGGLDSLLEPRGNIKLACQKAARAFGAEHTYFVTNGTSTANKIVVQALCRPGDIVLVDRNCHKSHHYGMVLSGAQPLYLDAYPLAPYSIYGGVPLQSIKKTLLTLKAAGKLDRVRMLLLTNCTFDGLVYHIRRVMEECLAIKPDLVFLWDEAWYAFARFWPIYRRRTAMGAVEQLRERYRDPTYRSEYARFKEQIGPIDLDNEQVLQTHLLPDPDRVRLRVYATQSTHKSLSALRQGSMIHVADDDFAEQAEELFEEAFMTHTSTSPNLQIIASLDTARRQAELEGYELVSKQIQLAILLRKEVNTHPLIAKYFRILTPAEMIPAEFRQTGFEDYDDQKTSWREVLDAWETDEFVLDPTRMTLMCGTAGFDGTAFKETLANEYDVQINKTSRNTVLFQSNISNTRSATAYLIEILAKLAKKLESKLAYASPTETQAFQMRVQSLVKDVPTLPDFSYFHDGYREDVASKTREGDLRKAFFAAYNGEACEHLRLDSEELEERLKNGPELISASFVIPYPPGFPIMVPGQVITPAIIEFMRKLDVTEIHGYHPDLGLKLIKPAVRE